MSDNFSDLVKFSEQNCNLLRSYLAPVKNHFGINNMLFAKIYRDNHLSFMCSNPNFLDYYLNNQLFKFDPLIISADNLTKGILFWSLINDPEFQGNCVYPANALFGFANPISILFPDEDSMVLLSLATYQANNKFHNKVINHVNLLCDYYQFLYPKIMPLIIQVKNYSIDMPIAKGPSFFSNSPVTSQISKLAVV